MTTVQDPSAGIGTLPPDRTVKAKPSGKSSKRTLALVAAGAVVAAGAITGLAAAVSGGGSDHSITVSATEYKFSAPSSVKAGETKFVLDDKGVLAHQAEIMKLNPGVTTAKLQGALMKSANGYIGLANPVGGPGGIPAGTTGTAWINLTPGQYVIACFLRGGTGTGPNHAMLGMVRPLTVTGKDAGGSTPANQGQVTLLDHAMKLPADFGAGTFRVVNAGSQIHELDILALTPGKTVRDFATYMKEAEAGKLPHGPAAAPPFHNAGGFSATGVKGTGYLSIDLPPGTYVATDFIPNIHTGIPDVAQGMLATFKVGS